MASLPLTTSDYLAGCLPKPSFVRTDRVLKIRSEIVDILIVQAKLKFVQTVRKSIIKSDARKFSRLAHAANRPGDDPLRIAEEKAKSEKQKEENISAFPSVPYAGRVFNEDEVEAAVSSTLDFWLTLGPEGEAFERELASFLGVKHSLLVNSGSSANLIALTCLTTHKLPDHKRLCPGDEVITCAAGFPTTVTPIIQNGCVPVFLDNDPVTGNARVDQLEAAYSPGKTKAVMLAHTLGNPFDLTAVLAFCNKYDLWLIEDNCDALGCTYSLPLSQAKSLGLDHLIKQAEANGEWRMANSENLNSENVSAFHFPPSAFRKIPFIENGILTAYTGSFGDLSTQSFYPPHHLTMGEGGAANIIRRASLKTYAESFRDWGRDCWCPSGKDNTCSKRFSWQLGELPDGYDHKYIYSHIGYNLKPLDPQAAIGRQQLKKLPSFIEARKQNWETLRRGLADLEKFFDFTLPTHATAWVKPANSEGIIANQPLTSPPSFLRHSDSPPSAIALSSSAIIHPPSAAGPCPSPSAIIPPPSAAGLPSAFSWDSSGCRTDCSWFGFMLRVKPHAPFTVRELAAHLDEKKIGNRMLFGGNLLRQPAFVQLRKDNPNAFRVVGEEKAKSEKRKDKTVSAFTSPSSSSPADVSAFSFQPSAFSSLPGADEIMHTAIFLGTYPGLTPAQLDYEIRTIREFVEQKSEK
ncbi:MAG: lipopolysaccharide biosynthesis protein RfbH [Verrucomicrobiae bacterium]